MISTLTKKHNFDMVSDSQKMFRLVLEAMSNPARVVRIAEYADKLFGNYSRFLAVAITFLDTEVGFCACANHSLSDDIVSLTLARQESLEAADFIFITETRELKNAIPKLKCGTLIDPQQSATVIIQNNGVFDCKMTLYGPGIDGRADVFATQTVKETIALRDAQNYEYPQGIDLLFISDGGDLIAIPRLTRMEVE